MSGAAAAAFMGLQAVQLIMNSIDTNLQFGSYLCPLDSPIETITTTPFDYIIVGGGSAGSVLANRLSSCTNKNILLLEAGGCPPLESICTGYFPLQPLSAFDYNMTAANDNYSCQNVKGGTAPLTSGKMLGGDSSLSHGMWVRSSPENYELWAEITGDPSWKYENLLYYFKKSETVLDEDILEEYGPYCGTNGPIKVKRQLSSETDGVLEALTEMGYETVNYSNADKYTNIAWQPLVTIGNDGTRQSALNSYISPVLDRNNLYILTGATVSKINFDNNKAATSVTFTYGDASYTVAVGSEVILATGAIKTPQLLMLSGVGPSDHLTEKGIPVISDLPVGDNLQDHTLVPLFFSLEEDDSITPAADPHAFPAPAFLHLTTIDDESAKYPDFYSINLFFPHDSAGLLQLCTNVLQYADHICDAISEANVGKKLMLSVCNGFQPESRGTVRLDTTDIEDQPIVNLGLLSENIDLVNLAKYLNHTAQLTNTNYFKGIGGEVKDLGLCSEHTLYSTEFWQCYVLAMSSTLWTYSGTASMGSVVDTNGMVYGVSNLRVVDASIFPTVPGGDNYAVVVAAAEKIAHMILARDGFAKTCTYYSDTN